MDVFQHEFFQFLRDFRDLELLDKESEKERNGMLLNKNK